MDTIEIQNIVFRKVPHGAFHNHIHLPLEPTLICSPMNLLSMSVTLSFQEFGKFLPLFLQGAFQLFPLFLLLKL